MPASRHGSAAALLVIACAPAPVRTAPPAAPAPAVVGELGPSVPCTRSYGAAVPAATIASRPAAEVLSLDAIDRIGPAGARLVVHGYPVDWHPCAPCPAGASCKPCESYAVLATGPMVGIKQPITPEHDLWVMMPDPESLVRGTAYRVVVDVCAGSSPVGSKAYVEWRGAIASPE